MALYVGHRKYDTYVGSHKVMFALKSEEPLPYDAEVEYIESTGTQWINTGVVFKAGLICVLDCLYTYSPSSTKVMIGASANAGLWAGSTNGKWGITGQTSNNPSSLVRHIVEIQYNSQTQLYIDGVFCQERTRSTVSTPIALFNAYNDNFHSSAILYSAKINDGGVIVFDGIPVRVGTTGYLYDKVSKQLFGNAGSGSFVVGPDKN